MFSDVAPLADALLRANLAQSLWVSDGPHPAIAPPMPADGHLIDASGQAASRSKGCRQVS